MKYIDSVKLNQLISDHSQKLIECGRLAHTEIIVNQCGRRIHHSFFGGATPTDIYRIASMTKPITVVALLQLVEAGKVNLFDPITKYLPEYDNMLVGKPGPNNTIINDHPMSGCIRVYNLLCHTSGIGSMPLSNYQSYPKSSIRDTAVYYASQPLAFDPNTAQSYSATAAFDVAARIIEIVSRESFEQYVKAHITQPLGMNNTCFIPNDKQWNHIVPMHNRDADGHSIFTTQPTGCVFENIPVQACAAGCGMISTAEDYSTFAEMLINDGATVDGTRILSSMMVKCMQTPHVPESIMDSSERWGLGVRVIVRNDANHHLPIGSYGWSGAYGSHFWIDPENNIAAVYMKNSLYDGGAGNYSSFLFEEDVMASLCSQN